MRREYRIGPLKLAARTGLAASMCHRILARNGLPPLAACDRATGEPVRRYECERPGRAGAHRRQEARQDLPRRRPQNTGYAFLHTALDDHSRLAYTEDLPEERAATCAAFLTRAAAWFAARGITIERVLTDNAWSYTKNTWRQTCHNLGIRPR